MPQVAFLVEAIFHLCCLIIRDKLNKTGPGGSLSPALLLMEPENKAEQRELFPQDPAAQEVCLRREPRARHRQGVIQRLRVTAAGPLVATTFRYTYSHRLARAHHLLLPPRPP